MMRVDKTALLCDFAEVYGIYDLYAFKASYISTLAVGLRENSRIKIKLMGSKLEPNFIVNLAMLDRLNLLVWFNTKAAMKGKKPPKSYLEMFLDEKETMTVEQFEEFKRGIING